VGLQLLVIPHQNEKDLVEMPANIKQSLKIIPVRWIDEVLSIALEKVPAPLQSSEKTTKTDDSKKKTVKNKTITAH